MKTTRKPPKAVPTATPPTPTPPETSVTSLSALSWFKEALIIALVTIVGSWFVLSFEGGYLNYFHIPYYFASISPSIVLGTWVLWVLLLSILCGVFVLFVSLNSFLIWLLNKNQGKSEENRVPVALKLVIGAVLVFFFVALAINGATFFISRGRKHAKSLDTFPVFIYSFDLFKRDVAVIRTYGEHVYAVPFKRDTTKIDQSGRKTVDFEKKLVIVKMSDIKVPLSFENIGHLQAEPEGESARDQSKK